jgi:branched-chain amino acid transport system permease protein
MAYYADIAVQILFLIMLAASFTVLFGYAGQVSMAHAAFYGIGAYTAGRLMLPTLNGVEGSGSLSGLGVPMSVALVVAGVGAAIVGLLIALPALSRVSGDYLILMTLAFQLIANQLMNTLDTVTGGSYGLTGVPPLHVFDIDLSTPTKAVWLILAATLVVLVIVYRLGASPFGRLLRGIREHETAVRAVGKDTVLPKLAAFGIAGGLAAVAGGLHGAYYQFISPSTFDLDLSILVVSIVVLGGTGNLIGAVVAAILLGVLRPIMQGVAGDDAVAWQAVVYGAALVLVMRFRPQGLLAEGTGFRKLREGLPRSGAAPSEPAAIPATARVPREPRLEAAPDHAPGDGSQPRAVLEVEGLSKRFGGVQAVQDVSFTLPEHLITGLVGPNGAGKTTVFNLITNTIEPDEGTVRLRGRDISSMSTVRIARHGMARSFQDGRLFTQISALDNVAIAVPGQTGEDPMSLALRPRRALRSERLARQKAREALDFVGLAGSADLVVANMSYGDQKLVAVARLIATECDVLLLDEPTAGVDPHAVEEVIETIRGLRALGRTICLVEHSVHMMSQLADHTLFMDQGRVLAEGTLDELMGQKELTEIYFGT